MSTKKMNATIDEIAREILGLETLETRRSDSLDFHDMGVWSIRKALETAYKAGRESVGSIKLDGVAEIMTRDGGVLVRMNDGKEISATLVKGQ